jgi:hypothetical protein
MPVLSSARALQRGGAVGSDLTPSPDALISFSFWSSARVTASTFCFCSMMTMPPTTSPLPLRFGDAAPLIVAHLNVADILEFGPASHSLMADDHQFKLVGIVVVYDSANLVIAVRIRGYAEKRPVSLRHIKFRTDGIE